jgi:hypothetical protein
MLYGRIGALLLSRFSPSMCNPDPMDLDDHGISMAFRPMLAHTLQPAISIMQSWGFSMQ